MAYQGLNTPYIAPLDVDAGTYSGGMKCGKLVSTNISPQYKEGSLAADDDSQAEYDKKLSYATVDLETDTLPIEVGKLMFGYEVGTGSGDEKDEVVFGDTDAPHYVGYGFIVGQTIHGVRSHVAKVLHKCLFTLGEESYTTSGDDIKFTGSKISGRASRDKNGKWKTEKVFSTHAEADVYLKKKLNITE